MLAHFEAVTGGEEGGFPIADIDSMPIVCDLKQFQASILDQYLQRSRTGVHGILDQFFQCMDWSNDDFPSGDLVHDILVKCLGICVTNEVPTPV